MRDMNEAGLRGKLLLFINQILHNSKFQIKLQHCYSSKRIQESGVARGSTISVSGVARGSTISVSGVARGSTISVSGVARGSTISVSGVARGSTISVSLFAIKIYSLSTVISKEIHASMFVDDVQISYPRTETSISCKVF